MGTSCCSSSRRGKGAKGEWREGEGGGRGVEEREWEGRRGGREWREKKGEEEGRGGGRKIFSSSGHDISHIHICLDCFSSNVTSGLLADVCFVQAVFKIPYQLCLLIFHHISLISLCTKWSHRLLTDVV